ncbi:hypothetical protein BDK51DRAFT_36820 [Blyttiomyces helicus]|uniref:Uncharacterized protein n=1 Tax=Blyttiomyces helicus TaxID=388810 RepID=A0A4P9W857_9FUNG|nr:hypothetical protein BDK51DRAFT_36820 [Blyttiomyces helicus]|eukprot:RKO87615.1 hypothetical protein BDK51DRAFT_36820 [Blyttiomyces helicus]
MSSHFPLHRIGHRSPEDFWQSHEFIAKNLSTNAQTMARSRPPPRHPTTVPITIPSPIFNFPIPVRYLPGSRYSRASTSEFRLRSPQAPSPPHPELASSQGAKFLEDRYPPSKVPAPPFYRLTSLRIPRLASSTDACSTPTPAST